MSWTARAEPLTMTNNCHNYVGHTSIIQEDSLGKVHYVGNGWRHMKERHTTR